MIYIIFAASGAGKTTLMKCVYEELGKQSVHKKGTTRQIRKYDDIEFEFFNNGLPEDRYGGEKGYTYSQYGYEYGIEKKQIDNAEKAGIPHFIVCNDIQTIKKIKADYPFRVRVVYLKIDASNDTIRAIQRARNISEEEIELRLSKIEYINTMFSEHSYLFDSVIINKYGENPHTTLWAELKRILYPNEEIRAVPDKEVIFETIDYLIDAIKTAERNKISTQTNVIEGFAFIIMPFGSTDEQKEALYHTYTCITSEAHKVGFRADRADYLFDSGTIDNKIYENIEKAELIIADLSYERPNCYFEVGYAKALGKDIIFISKEGTHLHFDVEHYDHISYKSERDLGEKLRNRLYAYKDSKAARS